MATWVLGHTDRFACIINHAGVNNSYSQFATDVPQGFPKVLGGAPWENVEGMLSTLSHRHRNHAAWLNAGLQHCSRDRQHTDSQDLQTVLRFPGNRQPTAHGQAVTGSHSPARNRADAAKFHSQDYCP